MAGLVQQAVQQDLFLAIGAASVFSLSEIARPYLHKVFPAITSGKLHLGPSNGLNIKDTRSFMRNNTTASANTSLAATKSLHTITQTILESPTYPKTQHRSSSNDSQPRSCTKTIHHTTTSYLPVATTTKATYITVTHTEEIRATKTLCSNTPHFTGALPSLRVSGIATLCMSILILSLLYLLFAIYWDASKQRSPTFRARVLQVTKQVGKDRDVALMQARDAIIARNQTLYDSAKKIHELEDIHQKLQRLNDDQGIKLRRLKGAFLDEERKEILPMIDLDLEHEELFSAWLCAWNEKRKTALRQELLKQYYPDMDVLKRQNVNLQDQIRQMRKDYDTNGKLEPQICDLQAQLMTNDEVIRDLQAQVDRLEQEVGVVNKGKGAPFFPR